MKANQKRTPTLTEAHTTDDLDEGLRDIAGKVAGAARSAGKSVMDRAAGRGPSKEQRKSTKEREKNIKTVSNRAFHAWKDYEDNVAKSIHNEDERNSFKNHDERWAKTFRAWVSKNLLKGQPVEAMDNASDLNHVINWITAGGDKQKMEKLQQSTARAARQQPATARQQPAARTPVKAPNQSAAVQPAVQAPAAAQPAPAQTPTQEPIEVGEPLQVSRAGVERISTDPMILRRGRTEYILGDEGAWVKQGQKHPENESMQALLDQAAEEFENSDAEQADAASQQRAAAGIQPVAPVKPAAVQAAPQQLVPGQTRAAPSPEQSKAEQGAFKKAQADQAALAAQQRAAVEKERQAQDAADRAAGIEPPSRGIKKVSGHGPTAKFEPLKEALLKKVTAGELTMEQAKVRYAQLKRRANLNEAASEEVERDAFTTLVRAAMLSQPESGAEPASSELVSGRKLSDKERRRIIDQQLPGQGSLPKMGDFFRDQYQMSGNKIKSTGNGAVDNMLTRMGFTVQ